MGRVHRFADLRAPGLEEALDDGAVLVDEALSGSEMPIRCSMVDGPLGYHQCLDFSYPWHFKRWLQFEGCPLRQVTLILGNGPPWGGFENRNALREEPALI